MTTSLDTGLGRTIAPEQASGVGPFQRNIRLALIRATQGDTV